MLKELVDLIAVLGKAKLLEPDDVPSYVALLVASGMDECTDLDLKIATSSAVNDLCGTYCGNFSDDRREMVRILCIHSFTTVLI